MSGLVTIVQLLMRFEIFFGITGSIHFQCFETIEQAYSYVDAEEMETPLILVHSGLYQGEYLFVDTNVSIIGAGG